MTRHVVVGTAGHIDHGKTALVLALTGVDTDRWAEEKRRGITIDLGFAPLTLGPDLSASVVDVPGHEAFVRNMLAGATGVDLALLVIAADEGIMPQTEEHLAILEFLGVARGVPVITKCDLVEPGWLDLVLEDLTERLARSRIPWAEPVQTAAIRGEGLDRLRDVLAREAGDAPVRAADDVLRLPIDRVFALPGAGTVVTGTVWSGAVAKGDTVRLLPGGRTARVRSVEVHGQGVQSALPGRRAALSLLDVSREKLRRGHVVVDDAAWRPSSALTCSIELLPGARRRLRRRERVRVHLGTSSVTGWLVGPADLAPGASLEVAWVALESPLVARAGDRFVFRGGSPVTTIGGGIVLDPYPRGRERPHASVPDLVDSAGAEGVPTSHLPIRLGMPRREAADLLDRLPSGVRRLGDQLVAARAVGELAAELVATVVAYHASHPFEVGMSRQELRAGAGATPDVVDAALELAAGQGRLVAEGPVVREPEWTVGQDENTRADLERLAQAVTERRWQFPSVGELEGTFGVEKTRPLLAVLSRQGRVVALDREHYVDRGALDEFAEALRRAIGELGSAAPSQLREATGLTRKHLIPLLEWADREGLTKRDGDTRSLVG